MGGLTGVTLIGYLFFSVELWKDLFSLFLDGLHLKSDMGTPDNSFSSFFSGATYYFIRTKSPRPMSAHNGQLVNA